MKKYLSIILVLFMLLVSTPSVMAQLPEPVVINVTYESGAGVGEGQIIQLLWTPMNYTTFGLTTEESTVSFLPLQHGGHILSTEIDGYLCSESIVLIDDQGIESLDNFTIICSEGLVSTDYTLWIPIVQGH